MLSRTINRGIGMEKQLRCDVEALAAPGTRKVGSDGHGIARSYIVEQMRLRGLVPYEDESYELSYRVETTDYVNLAGILPGNDCSLAPVLLVAHYDTCGDQPGADDNAAAIATWFAVLDQVKQCNLDRDLIFLFPDAEEPPRFKSDHMGSTNFYRHQLQRKIHTGLVLDLVGHDVPVSGMEDILFIFGAESNRALAHLLEKVDLPDGLRNIATLNRYVGDLSDHHILRENNEPYLFFTCGRWEHYHQDTDIPEHLNYGKMMRITDYLTTLIKSLDKLELAPSSDDYDPIKTELMLIQRALGPYLAQMGIPMKTRDDMQRFVLAWVNQYHL